MKPNTKIIITHTIKILSDIIAGHNGDGKPITDVTEYESELLVRAKLKTVCRYLMARSNSEATAILEAATDGFPKDVEDAMKELQELN